jgi:cyclin-dependent kinase 12/13
MASAFSSTFLLFPESSVVQFSNAYICQFQKRQAQANTKSRSEMFNPCKEDSASGFPMEPPRSTHATESSEDSKRVYPARTFHSGPLVNHPSKPGPSRNGELHVAGVADPQNFPVVFSARSNTRSDDSNGTVVTQAEAFSHGRRLSESINGPFSSSGKYDKAFHQKDDKSSRVDGAIVSNSKLQLQKGINYSYAILFMVTAWSFQISSVLLPLPKPNVTSDKS